MCTRYLSPETADIERHWRIDKTRAWRGGELFPGRDGAFLRAARDSAAAQTELVVGRWGLIPGFAKDRKLKVSTCNARSEELAAKPSYRQPWARGQRCIIPAWAFFEPCWETGRHVPWVFRRPDRAPWGLAGLWATWTDPASGEIVESYTMLTINADAHPLMRRMHKPDPARGPAAQDKRAVVPIEREDAEAWLFGAPAQAHPLVRLAGPDAFDGAPADAEVQGTLGF